MKAQSLFSLCLLLMGFSLVLAQANETVKANPNPQEQKDAPLPGKVPEKGATKSVPEARQSPETNSDTKVIVSMNLVVLLAIAVLGWFVRKWTEPPTHDVHSVYASTGSSVDPKSCSPTSVDL